MKPVSPSPVGIAPRALALTVLASVVLHWAVLSRPGLQWAAPGMAQSGVAALHTRHIEPSRTGAAPAQRATVVLPPKISQKVATLPINNAQAATKNIADLAQNATPSDPALTPPAAFTELTAVPSAAPATPTLPIALAAAPPAAPPAPQASNTDPAAASTAGGNAAAPAMLVQLPAPMELAFTAIRQGTNARQEGYGHLVWKTDGQRYELRLESKAFFLTLFAQSSVGSLGAQGLLPERFSDKRLHRGEQATHFERDKGHISFSNNRPAAALLGNGQDRLSVIVQLASMLAGDSVRYASASTISLPVAGTGEADVWLFTVEGEELLQLPAGQISALRLVRNPRREFDPRLELWFASGHAYMPVRIKQTETNGNFTDLLLRSPLPR